MTEHNVRPGETVAVQEIEPGGKKSRKLLLVKTRDVEIVQFILPAGDQIPTYEAQGELIAHCLHGRVTISARAIQHELKARELLYLSTNEPFSIRAIETTSLLVTIIAAKQDGPIELIGK